VNKKISGKQSFANHEEDADFEKERKAGARKIVKRN